MDTRSALINSIVSNEQRIQNARREERRIRSIETSSPMTYSSPAVRNPLKEALEGLLPADKIPANVGDLNEIQWDYFYQTEFDFGNNHTYSNIDRQERQFKVSSEAAFLVTRIYRDCSEYSNAAFGAPLTLTMRDNQSSRQLNDFGIPVQAFVSKYSYFELEVPFLLYPAATFTTELKCWLPTGVTIPTEGNSKQTFSFYGARIRLTDPEVILKAMMEK